jgi:hypothetical protein
MARSDVRTRPSSSTAQYPLQLQFVLQEIRGKVTTASGAGFDGCWDAGLGSGNTQGINTSSGRVCFKEAGLPTVKLGDGSATCRRLDNPGAATQSARHDPPGRDLFGEVLAEARKRGMRVIGRFDLSKTRKPVYAAHPEWFFRRANGEPAIYSGLYSVCINGGYYRDHALTILTEALERHAVDGLFFNMFGNPGSDYSGKPMGPCHCDACHEGFQARYDRPLPAVADTDHREFMAIPAREVAASIAALIHRLRLARHS